MGVVISFPACNATSRARSYQSADRRCEVVILPVIRIDRYEDSPVIEPVRRGMAASKRRRRACRS